MSQIVIGKAEAHNVSIDRKVLMTTRLLITSDSGGGKTWLLKRLIEQAFGQVGIIVIDPEGEFAPLRTKFDFFLVGKGGDTPADIRTAEKVARTLLEGRASAICDIYEMTPSEQHIWVQRFLDALVRAPKELRYPYFVIVDESHMFAPEKGKGESVASDPMRALASRGRKRMLCGIYATQRLASLSKDITGMCLNRLVGPTFESINQKRGADELGIAKPEQQEFFASVKMLEPGYFYALGRAITKDLKLVHVGPIETPHGQEALKYELKPPPPTEKVREWLAKLGDLPKQAEEEARTTADFKRQIRELKVQLRAQPKPSRQDAGATTDPRAIERAVREVRSQAERQIAMVHADAKLMWAHGRRLADALGQLAEGAAAKHFDTFVPELPKLKIPGGVHPPGSPLGEIQTKGGSSRPVEREVARSAAHPRPDVLQRTQIPNPHIPQGRSESNGDGELSARQMEILCALAELEAVGQAAPSKECVAVWSRYKATGGGFGNNLGNLKTKGFVHYPGQRTVALTDHGRAKAGPQGPPSHQELAERAAAILSGPQKKILDVLREIYPEAISKEELAERTGYRATGGGFGNLVGNMRTAGIATYPSAGTVKCAEWLFLE